MQTAAALGIVGSRESEKENWRCLSTLINISGSTALKSTAGSITRWPRSAGIFYPADLQPLLENNGFQGSVVVQVRQTLEETQWLLKLADANPFILGVVGWVDLCSPELRAQLESFAGKPKLVGIRHIVQGEPDGFLLRPDFLRGISLLEEFDVAYDILIYPKHLPAAVEFVRRFPRQRFVLDHLAKPPIKSGAIDGWARGIRELASFPNVYAKLSGLVTEADWEAWTPEDIWPYLDVAFECFGSGPIDDRVGLASVSLRGVLQAGDERRKTIPGQMRCE